jgi:predicted nucleic acid-binding protein
MSRWLFVDTSAWYALADGDDPNHRAAGEFLPQALRSYARLVTTNHVIGEMYTLLRTRLGYAAAQEFLHRVQQSARLDRVFVSAEQEQTAYQLLTRYKDQDFSFVDGVSFVVMGAMGIEEAFAFDRHFTVAGFIVRPAAKV